MYAWSASSSSFHAVACSDGVSGFGAFHLFTAWVEDADVGVVRRRRTIVAISTIVVVACTIAPDNLLRYDNACACCLRLLIAFACIGYWLRVEVERS